MHPSRHSHSPILGRRILHTHFSLPNASVKQRKLLRILLHFLLERVLQSHAHDASYDMQETSTHWGKIQKHMMVQAHVAYKRQNARRLWHQF